MSNEPLKVNDPGQLRQIIEKLFLRLPVLLKEKEREVGVQITGFQSDLLEIVHDRPNSNVRIITLRHNDQLLLLECTVVEKNSAGNELVKPIRLHLHRQVRKLVRLEVPAAVEGPLVTGFITVAMFPEKLSQNNETREALVRIYREKLKHTYPEVSIVLRKSIRMDVRMRIMNQNGRSVFAPDRKDPIAWGPLIASDLDNKFITFRDYEEIRNYEKLDDLIVSEISIPIFYRDFYLYGYVQVLSGKQMTQEDYRIISAAAKSLGADFEKRGSLPDNKEKCPVLDINRAGIGLLHPPNSPALKSFMAGQEVIFDMEFPGPDPTREAFRGIIRNIRPLEKAYRIGVQFEEAGIKSAVLEAYVAEQEKGKPAAQS